MFALLYSPQVPTYGHHTRTCHPARYMSLAAILMVALITCSCRYSKRVSEQFLDLGGVEAFSKLLEVAGVHDSSLTLLHASERYHVMALTTLHVCLHVMKTVRGGDNALLDKMLATGLPRVLMTLVRQCCDIGDRADLNAVAALQDGGDEATVVGDAKQTRMHAQRTCALAFQSLTEASFNNFDTSWLATSFPESEIVPLVSIVALVFPDVSFCFD